MKALIDDLLTALDPAEFARRRLGFSPDSWQEEVLRSTAGKVILRCSRQSGKSTTTAALALHSAIHDPGSLTLLFSASLRQSRELFRKVRDFLEIYREGEGGGPPLLEDNKLEARLASGSRIVSLPAKESTIRGFSKVSLAVFDEAAYIEDEVYKAARPMLAVSGGRLILLSTPHGKRGFFWGEWNNPEFEKYHIPADQCPRISPEFLAQEQREIGSYWFRQEYLCSFLDLVGSVFSHDTIQACVEKGFTAWDL